MRLSEQTQIFLRRDFRWKKTQNKQFPRSYEIFVREKLLPLLFNIGIFLFCELIFYLFCVFCVVKISLKKTKQTKIFLRASFTILLSSEQLISFSYGFAFEETHFTLLSYFS